MRRPKTISYLISIAGILLGSWLTLGGLELRFFGTYLAWHQTIALLQYPEHLFKLAQLDLGGTTALAWPMVVFGSSWGGALIGYWVGERWSVAAMTLLAALALAFPIMGSVLGASLLFLIFGIPASEAAAQANGNEARI